MTTSFAKTTNAWTPIADILMSGRSNLPEITVSSRAEARSIRTSLREAGNRQPWLIPLVASDVDRLLGAAGISLKGEARDVFSGITVRRQEEDLQQRFAEATLSPAVPQQSVTSASPAKSGSSLQPQLSDPQGRLDSLGSGNITRYFGQDETQIPVLAATEPGRSHDEHVNYQGHTGGWDAVLQIHESFLQRQYDIIMAAQAANILGQALGAEGVIPFSFSFESWLFIHLRCDIVLEAITEPPKAVLSEDALDEAGMRFRFQATTFMRLLSDDPWSQTDTFTGVFSRYGSLIKPGRVELGGQTFKRTWAADLAGGKTVFELDDGPDAGREAMAGPALDAYFAQHMPLMPITPTFTKSEQLLSYPNSAGFCYAESADHDRVSLCFSEDADDLIEDAPFRHYILDHGRNFAAGVSIARIEREILDEIALPITEGGATVETLSLASLYGKLIVTATGKGPLGIKFTQELGLSLSLVDGVPEAEVDSSNLTLPWWLWFLNSLLLAPLLGGPTGGLVVTAITNLIANTIIGQQAANLLNLSSIFDSLGLQIDAGDDIAVVKPERLEVAPTGVFVKGNIEIVVPQL